MPRVQFVHDDKSPQNRFSTCHKYRIFVNRALMFFPLNIEKAHIFIVNHQLGSFIARIHQARCFPPICHPHKYCANSLRRTNELAQKKTTLMQIPIQQTFVRNNSHVPPPLPPSLYPPTAANNRNMKN